MRTVLISDDNTYKSVGSLTRLKRSRSARLLLLLSRDAFAKCSNTKTRFQPSAKADTDDRAAMKMSI